MEKSSPEKFEPVPQEELVQFYFWWSQTLSVGNTQKIWAEGTENCVEKSSPENFEPVPQEELIQFYFWWSQTLSVGNTQKIWAGQMDPKTLNFQTAG